MHKQAKGSILLLLCAMIWGAAFVAQSEGMQYVGPFTMGATRFFLAGLVLLPVIAWREEHNPANKKAHGLPIFDAAREAVVLEKAAARIQNAALRPYYKDHVQNMMDVAKQYEAEVLGRNRAAYQGVEGAFAHIALRALFPHAEAVSCPTWDEVFDAVSRGDTAHGVVPFENSHAGDVSAVLDLCYNHPELWVVDVYDLPISQNLLVLPGTQLAQLKHV